MLFVLECLNVGNISEIISLSCYSSFQSSVAAGKVILKEGAE